MPSPSPIFRRVLRSVFPLPVLLLAACPVLLRAQQPVTGKPAVEFSCLAWEPLPIPAVLYRDGKERLPLDFETGNRSRLYPLKEGAGLELYAAQVGSAAAADQLVGKAPLIPGTRRMLFLIFPARESTGLPLRIVGLDDSLNAFPPGNFRFFNFSATPLHVKFGGQTSSLPAGEIKVVKSGVSSDGGLLPIYILDARGTKVFENRLFAQSDSREMVFIGPPDSAGGAPKVSFVTEVIPPEPPQPPSNP